MPMFNLRRIHWPAAACVLLCAAVNAASDTQITLLSQPIQVTASFNSNEIGTATTAQIEVHSGPITQLVSTTAPGKTASQIEGQLRQDVVWRTPYLFVHSSCAGGNAWRCDGEVVFTLVNEAVMRLGDLIGSNADSVYHDGHFFDVYDKLEQQVDTLSHATSPAFKLVLDDVDNVLVVNAAETWAANAPLWRKQAIYLSDHHPNRSWSETDWENYLSAVVNSAALARYCNRNEELQQLTKNVEPELDAYRRRAFTDALSKVVPLEKPKAWRKPY